MRKLVRVDQPIHPATASRSTNAARSSGDNVSSTTSRPVVTFSAAVYLSHRDGL
ncbi:hypothetical protein [Nonomuraea sp. NEAU-A123]|uniref:hypothetical protein n=1 Tax=Nonomuraea sp. NEAU-A123 TaxID=2839649 RepID=UPI001BE48FCE|nr:hypothetical protein [Nonomuraea sp. NEAU-A123]MBT2224305.1 hypothetical protein [Nonomuraea sp. NEAU-A123]